MSMRRALPREAEIVSSIVKNTISITYPHYYAPGAVEYFLQHHEERSIAADIEEEKVWLCFDGAGQPVGTVTVDGNRMTRLFVLPDHQRKGYGREMLDIAEMLIFEKNDEIVLDSSLPAKKIYANRGYVVKSCEQIRVGGGDYLCYDIMTKKRPAEAPITVRSMKEEDVEDVARVIAATMSVSNRDDYTEIFIANALTDKKADNILANAKKSHIYVACDGNKIVGCGTVAPMNGSKSESVMSDVFVLPKYQHKGTGTLIIAAIESDDYFSRAQRVELLSTITAKGFWEKMGYDYVNGVKTVASDGYVRMEKRK